MLREIAGERKKILHDLIYCGISVIRLREAESTAWLPGAVCGGMGRCRSGGIKFQLCKMKGSEGLLHDVTIIKYLIILSTFTTKER